ncbi:ApeA N-terminal domain 1-containing protein [Lyngbya aestuarii]|uniref:ApeA N-terminal domain 1-containing protein n=1 Tax=Lyngbya aestuarii TaxID=118322 RepID=UPI00403DA141
MRSATEYAGYWWLPTNPDKTVSGTLHIDRYQGIELKTIDSLLSRQEVFAGNLEFLSKEIILGQTVDNKLITLIDCHYSDGRFSSTPDLSTSLHTAKFALVGQRQFENKRDVTFTSAEVRFSLLDEWLAIQPFQDGDINTNGLTLEYRRPEPIQFYIDSIGAQFYTNYVGSRNNPRYLKWEMTHSSYLRLTPDMPQSLDWYMKQFYSLQKLLIIMTGFPVSPTVLIGHGDDVHATRDITIPEQFEIYFDLHKNFQNFLEKHPANLFYTVPQLEVELSVVVNNWFQKADILEPATNLHVATLSSSSLYTEFKLLNYAQAIEALHRRVFGGKYVSDEDYRPIRDTLIENIPNNVDRDHRNTLKNKIKYGNEFSQRKRLRLLLDEIWEDCLCEFITDKQNFISDVVETRNYLIHFDANSAAQAVLDGSGMFRLAEQLKIILITHVLIQLDIPRENIYRAVKQFNRFAELRHRD